MGNVSSVPGFTPGFTLVLLPGVDSNECISAKLVWAGDLDGDGNLDLIILDDEKVYLFLSSGAPPGRLVRLAAACRRHQNC